jgi:hypothetical protein
MKADRTKRNKKLYTDSVLADYFQSVLVTVFHISFVCVFFYEQLVKRTACLTAPSRRLNENMTSIGWQYTMALELD